MYINKTWRNVDKIVVGVARDFSLSLARVYCGALLVEHAMWSNEKEDWIVASSYINGTMQGNWFGNNNKGLVAATVCQVVLNVDSINSDNNEDESVGVMQLLNDQMMNQIGLGLKNSKL